MNKAMRYKWKWMSSLPDALNKVLETFAEAVITSRQSVLLSGPHVPRIEVLGGVVPRSTWYNEEIKILLLELDSKSKLFFPEIRIEGTSKDTLINLTCTVPDTRSVAAANSIKHSERVNEQSEFVKYVLGRLFYNPLSTPDGHKQVEVVNLNGAAGCGKTFSLRFFKIFERALDINYVSLMNVLSQRVRFEHGVSVVTYCKFMMKRCNLNYIQYQILQERMKHIHYSKLMDINVEEFVVNKSLAKLLYLFRLCRPKMWKFFKHEKKVLYYFDEYSQLNTSDIMLFIKLVEAFAMVSNVKVLIVFAGDSCQIHPLFVHPMNEYVGFFENICTKIFNFQSQQRFKDSEYEKILNVLRSKVLSNSDDQQKLELLTFLRENLKTGNDICIDYQYPIDQFSRFPKVLNELDNVDSLNLSNWADWLSSSTNFDNVLNILPFYVFSFTNEMISYHNHSISLSVYNQLACYKKENISSFEYVAFQVLLFQVYKFIDDSKIDTLSFDPPSQACKHRWKKTFVKGYPYHKSPAFAKKVSVLPLVRFFPYKLLSYSVPSLSRLTVVHLLEWNSNFAIVCDLQTRTLHVLRNDFFSMNLFPDRILYGFPLQMCFGETFQSSQGLTIKKKIYADFTGATLNEIYVILSRIPSFSHFGGVVL